MGLWTYDTVAEKNISPKYALHQLGTMLRFRSILFSVFAKTLAPVDVSRAHLPNPTNIIVQEEMKRRSVAKARGSE